MNGLIPGGIYTDGCSNICYIFISELSDDYLFFLRLNNTTSSNVFINKHLEEKINNSSKTELKYDCVKFDKFNFINNYSGFIGNVKEELFDKLKEFVFVLI